MAERESAIYVFAKVRRNLPAYKVPTLYQWFTIPAITRPFTGIALKPRFCVGTDVGSLTARGVQTAKPGRHTDGRGLMLVVKPSRARSWVLRYQINGWRRGMGLAGRRSLPSHRGHPSMRWPLHWRAGIPWGSRHLCRASPRSRACLPRRTVPSMRKRRLSQIVRVATVCIALGHGISHRRPLGICRLIRRSHCSRRRLVLRTMAAPNGTARGAKRMKLTFIDYRS